MVAEIRLDIEGVAEPGRRAEANDRPTLRAPLLIQRRVPALSEDVMLPWRLPTEADGKTCQAVAQLEIRDTTRIAVQSSFPETPAAVKSRRAGHQSVAGRRPRLSEGRL
jgi:hypothetical protein